MYIKNGKREREREEEKGWMFAVNVALGEWANKLVFAYVFTSSY